MKAEDVTRALGQRVRLNYLTGGGHHAEGTLVGYYAEPTVIIRTDDGREVPWVLKAAEVVEPKPDTRRWCLTCTDPRSDEARFCPQEQKYKLVCKSDHCMECGAAT